MNKIAVLLTCHNRKNTTLDCLKVLYRCGIPNDYSFDVFLVDDGCTDGTGEAVRDSFPLVNVIQGDGNLFWNRGMHKAWKTATEHFDYDYYLWLNDDTILHKNAIYVLVETSDTEENKSIICGSTCSTSDENAITYGGKKYIDKIEAIPPNGKKQICNCFNGNIVLIPRFVYSIVGYNDPFFHHAWGDLDYGLRAKKHGIKSIVSPIVLGVCSRHDVLPLWENPKVALKKRLAVLHSPFGMPPKEVFRFHKRHRGFLLACRRLIKIYLRVFFGGDS